MIPNNAIVSYGAPYFSRELFKLLEPISEGKIIEALTSNDACIAGGALTSVFRGAPAKDYDVYCQTQEKCDALYADLRQKCGMKTVFHSDNAETLVGTGTRNRPIVFQIIHVKTIFDGFKKWAETQWLPSKKIMATHFLSFILTQFDFTACMLGYCFSAKEFYVGRSSFLHIAQRRLVYNWAGLHPISSLFRAKKYVAEKGFSISGVELIKLGLKIHGTDISTYAKLREQIMGVDLLFLMPLTDMMKKRGDEVVSVEVFLGEMESFIEQNYNLENEEQPESA